MRPEAGRDLPSGLGLEQSHGGGNEREHPQNVPRDAVHVQTSKLRYPEKLLQLAASGVHFKLLTVSLQLQATHGGCKMRTKRHGWFISQETTSANKELPAVIASPVAWRVGVLLLAGRVLALPAGLGGLVRRPSTGRPLGGGCRRAAEAAAAASARVEVGDAGVRPEEGGRAEQEGGEQEARAEAEAVEPREAEHGADAERLPQLEVGHRRGLLPRVLVEERLQHGGQLTLPHGVAHVEDADAEERECHVT